MVRFYVPPSLVILLWCLGATLLARVAVGFYRGCATKRERIAFLGLLFMVTVGATIQSGASTDLWTIDATSKAGRVTLYDTSGNAIGGVANRSAVAETAGGMMQAGKNYKVSLTQRMSSIGTTRVTDNALFLYDAFEGTVRNSTVWVETATTQASAQALATGLTLNSASTLTTTTGILESSHRQFPLIPRTGLLFHAHLRVQGATNCVEEWGFSDQSSATVALNNNGAFFRRDSAGSVQPVLAFNGVETQGATMTIPATTEYGWYEVFLENAGRATFQVFSATGTILSSQVMEIGSSGGGAGAPTQARLFATTHIPAMLRVYNTGAAGTAPQIVVNQVAVQMVDADVNRDVRVQQSGMGYNSSVSPTAFTQLATWANSANPGAVTISNTTCGVSTLGGLVNMNSIAGNVTTDLCLVGWANPSPYTFYFTGIHFGPPQNLVAAVATTATNFTNYGLAFNSSAASLATAGTYPPMRVSIGGVHKCAVAVAVGDNCAGNDVDWRPGTPIAVQPGKFLHVILRVPIGTATATETFLFQVAIDGFFE